MSISTEIERLQNAKAEIKSAIEEKGVEVGDGRIDTYAEKISQITSGDGGYDEGYEAGQKAEYDSFWDAVQNYGNRTNYNRGFCGLSWTDTNFKPKYDIRPSEPNAVYSMFGYAAITDLAKILEEKKVVLDTSNASGLFQEMFANSKVTRIPTLNITKASGNAGVTNMFANCNGLTTIEKIIISENTPTGYMFNGVSNLENVIFEGVIGNNIDFSTCSKLTHESLMSIINALKDFSGTTTTKTLTLHANSKALLTDSEKAIATQKGWTIV
jgi:hypothetical protein